MVRMHAAALPLRVVMWVKSMLGRVACVDFGSFEQACCIEQMFDRIDMLAGPAVVRR